MFGFKNKPPIQRNYVSELDRFLEGFDKAHPEVAFSDSRRAEIKKYEKIAQLRDGNDAHAK